MPAGPGCADDPESCDHEPEEATDEKPKKMTKSQLFAAYKGVGPHRMNFDILDNDTVRAHGEIIVHITRPLHKFYQDELKLNSGEHAEMIQWVAARAQGQTQQVVSEILAAQASSDLYRRMRCTPHCNPPAAHSRHILVEDIELTRQAFRFVTELAGNIGWAQQLNKYTLPLAAGALLARDRNEQEASLLFLKSLVEAVIAAEEMCATTPSIQTVLKDLAVNDEPFAREMMSLLLRGDFNIESEQVQSVKDSAMRLFSSSSSTKEVLESTFGHLKDLSVRANSNSKMNPHLCWLYCTTSPYVHASGMKQALPDEAQWTRCGSKFGLSRDEQMKEFYKAFAVKSAFPMPESDGISLPKSVMGITRDKWRTAGPLSHYTASAAAAYLIHDAPSNFRNQSLAWAGRHL